MAQRTTAKLGNWADGECFYVSIQDAGRSAMMAGPFKTHHAALAAVDTARTVGCKLDPWASFYGWGTCKLENGYKDGSLNAKLSESHPEIERGEWN